MNDPMPRDYTYAMALATLITKDIGNEKIWGAQVDAVRRVYGICEGYASVTAALGEEKHDLPESEWGYCLHVINDVDGSDCELYHTDHLSEEELVNLLNDLMKKMEKGEL